MYQSHQACTIACMFIWAAQQCTLQGMPEGMADTMVQACFHAEPPGSQKAV